MIQNYFRHMDYVLLATVASICAFGLWILKTGTKNDPGSLYSHQVIYMVVGWTLLLLIAAIPTNFLRRLSWPLYVFVILTTGIVLVLGTTVQGGTRWISLGPFQFQPSEFAKLFLIVGLASLLAARRGTTSPAKLTWIAIGYIGLPALLVFLEPDFGTTLVLATVVMGMLFVFGAPWRHFVYLFAALGLSIAMVFIILPDLGVQVLQQYQRDRLTAFLNPSTDQQDGYHLLQSRIAIAHGGAVGRGPAGATQTQLGFLPEHSTDFIFAVVGEERGFLGAAWLIGLYALLVWRGLKIITLSRSTFGSLVAAGIVSAFVFQIFINIGMTIGLAPITGIPLPFMSFGGSHTIVGLMSIGVLEAIHVHAQMPDEPRFA
jgi:rod shape determining protein RodA